MAPSARKAREIDAIERELSGDTTLQALSDLFCQPAPAMAPEGHVGRGPRPARRSLSLPLRVLAVLFAVVGTAVATVFGLVPATVALVVCTVALVLWLAPRLARRPYYVADRPRLAG